MGHQLVAQQTLPAAVTHANGCIDSFIFKVGRRNRSHDLYVDIRIGAMKVRKAGHQPAHGDAMRRFDDKGFVLDARSEEHTSELQSLMRISYAVFCLKKKKKNHTTPKTEE